MPPSPAPTLRVFSEHVPYPRLRAPRLLEALAARGVTLAVAVFPDQTPAFEALLAEATARGARLAPWPLLHDREGRWLNVRSLDAHRAHTLALLDRLARAGLPAPEVVLDLEPPIGRLRELLHGRARGLLARTTRRRTRGGLASLTAYVDELTAHGVPATATVAPVLFWDRPGGEGPYARLLGTPLPDRGLARVLPMAYTSLMEGYARGTLRRADARVLLHRFTARTVERLGPEAGGVALGVVGGGALGDERPYRSVAELADDVALARAAGARDIALYSLDGMLLRPPVEAWLDALAVPTGAPAAAPAWTRRTRTLWSAGRVLGRDV